VCAGHGHGDEDDDDGGGGDTMGEELIADDRYRSTVFGLPPPIRTRDYGRGGGPATLLCNVYTTIL